jgi:peptidoglycan/LPS O-acetylase OafA/YrhL
LRRLGSLHGSAIIEFPVVLLLLGLFGIAVALLIHYLIKALPWYAWPLSFLCLPVAAIAFGLSAFLADEHRQKRRSRPWFVLSKKEDDNDAT